LAGKKSHVKATVDTMNMISVTGRLNRDARRDHILDVARECFLRDGYAGCSMSTIAARLGGSKGTLYNYFRSKEQLFEAFVRRACERFAEAISEAPPADGDLRQRLVHIARAFQDHLLSPDAIAVQRLVVGEGERFPELGPLFYAAGPKIIIAKLSAEFAGLIASGRLRQADPDIAARQFKDLAVSSVQWRRIWGVINHPSAEELDGHAASGVDTFLRAYRPD
jgi:AcrR family transcriptional regulator